VFCGLISSDDVIVGRLSWQLKQADDSLTPVSPERSSETFRDSLPSRNLYRGEHQFFAIGDQENFLSGSS
jgi:hypothetical protein